MDKWTQAYADVTERFAELSTAKRLKVGAIAVKDNRILSIGYNGMPSGWDNCCEKEIPEAVDAESRTITPAQLVTKPEVIHAESNCLSKLARSNESSAGCVMFVTHAPCVDCAKLMYQCGIEKVYYINKYKSQDGVEFLEKCNVSVEHLSR